MDTDETKVRDGSDYYKAVFGHWPSFNTTPADAYNAAAAEMKRRSATPDGRNALRQDGWMLDGDPDWNYRE